jgi:hypothetical protein
MTARFQLRFHISGSVGLRSSYLLRIDVHLPPQWGTPPSVEGWSRQWFDKRPVPSFLISSGRHINTICLLFTNRQSLSPFLTSKLLNVTNRTPKHASGQNSAICCTLLCWRTMDNSNFKFDDASSRYWEGD